MTQTKNILWLIDGLGMGGAERLMAPYLRHLDTTKFTPRVCVLQSRVGHSVADQIRELGVPVDFLHVPRLRSPSGLPRLYRYLGQHNIDLIHTQLEFANVLGSTAARLHHIPAVCTLHTIDDPEKNKRRSRHIR